MLNLELDRAIKNFKNGTDEAFDMIYEETKKLVYLSIYPIIHDTSQIEDLMQDTYLKAIESLDSYQYGTNFKAWICKIAHNLAINQYNKNKKVEVLDDEMMDSIPSEDKETNETSLIDDAYTILNQDNTPYEKEIFTYRIILDLKFKEISEILDLPKSTVFDIYNRAINKIKNKI